MLQMETPQKKHHEIIESLKKKRRAMPFAMLQCAKSFVQNFTGIASEDFNDFVAQHLEAQPEVWETCERDRKT